MKKNVKIISSVLLCFCLVLQSSLSIAAADNNMIIQDNESRKVQKKQDTCKISFRINEGKGSVKTGLSLDSISTSVDAENSHYETEASIGDILYMEIIPESIYEISKYKITIDNGKDEISVNPEELNIESSYKNEIKIEGEDIDVEISFSEKQSNETVNTKLLCDDKDCLTNHVGKTLKPEDVSSILYGIETRKVRREVKTAEPYIGMVSSGINADVTFLGADPSAPGDFAVSFNDGDYMSGIYVEGFTCLNHGAANPGVGGPVQCTYEATVIDIDESTGTVTWSIIVTPPGACVEGSVFGYQRVGGVLETSWNFPRHGIIELIKSSSNPELTNNNECYSLAGAQYGVYIPGQGDAPISTLITDETGYAKADNILAGDYWIKELVPPKGFGIDKSSHHVVVIADETSSVNVVDHPQSDPVKVVLGKIDAETNTNKPLGSNSLKDAEFTVKYFKGFFDTNPEQQGMHEERLWVLRTDEDGYCDLSDAFKVSGDDFYYMSNGDITLPLGTITIQETKAPKGYLLNKEVFVRKITPDGTAEAVNTYNQPIIPEQVIRGGVYVEKWDAELNRKNAQGGASLQGGKVQLISLNEKSVLVEGVEYQKDQIITTLTTDANGAISIAADYLPWGDYKMVEKSPPPGYLNSGVTERTFQIRENGKIVQLNTQDTAIKDNVIRGGVKIQKWDSETNQNKPQGSASLQGAEFQLITLNDNPVLVESKTYSKNEVIKKFTTDKNGTIQVDGNYLPKGKYRWIEVKPPNGYNLTGTLQRDFEIKENGKIVQMTTSSTAIKNDIIRGDLQLVKFRESQDEDEDQKTPLDGITFTLTSKESGDKFEIVTDKNGYANTKQLGISSRGNLVYGNYTVHESNTPVGLKPIKDFDITINKEGQTLYYILEDKLIMSPVQFIKADATTGKLIPLAGAEFQLLDKDKKPITMTTHYPNTVVHYTFKTDESGSFVLPEKLAAGSYYWREIMAPDGYQRNPNDMKFSITDGHDWQDPFVVEFTDTPAMGKIKIVKTDETTGKAIAGTVFEIKAKEDIVTPDGTVRLKKGEVADTITTDANGLAESKKLFLGWYITAEKKQTPGFVLSDKTYDVKLKYKDQETSVVLGEVEISNLPTFAQLVKMDSKTKEPLQGVTFDVWNNSMLEEPDAEGVKKETYTTDEEGLIQLKYLVPGTYCFQEVKTLPGYVLNEKVFSMVIDKDGRVNGEDIGVLEVENTLTQLLGTKARDKDTGTQEAIAKRDTTTIDTIDFKSLQIGAEYTIEGILMEQATNKPVVIDGKVVTAEKKFIPDTTNESADVVFNYDASGLKGKTIVVFEKVFVEGKEILAHEDINDKEQAIHFPEVKIKTTMLDQDTGTHEAVAKKDAVHIDTVKYEGAIAKLEYIIKGILMDSATGKPVMENGKTVTAETTVTPKEKNGSVDLKYTYDASAQKGRAVVSFVKMYYKDTEVGSHEAINDKGQTVVFPKGKIKTTAKGKDTGTKEVIAKKDAVIVDAVFYEDLIVGQPHNLRGILMEQDTGKPLLIDNKEVTAEKEFIPKEKKGTVELEFSFNASGLKNKKLVVFEKVYVGETEVAAHEDINDEDQTVIVKLGKLSVNMPNLKNNGLWTSIKTGDTSAIFPVLLGVISSLSLAIGMSIYWKRRRQKNEEE